ncbi:MAG TPA: pantoate--beta-alanine ligase [Alphaproteobacteria bacterium]|nr:pantoate--beta-alanine ligase [Alphaproteobacteria bacterium]
MASNPTIKTVRTIAELRAAVTAWRGEGLSVGLIPTMGALHEGHLALARAAKAECDRAVASIFVNPAQFGPSEDLDRYPRREAEDAAALATLGVELIFAPPVEEIYPGDFVTTVTVAGVAERLEGAHRPGHFAGVTTVVSKLLIQARADRAYFGEKDYQQLRVVTRMARDLDIATMIVGVPTVREPDGLALSSRNEYLTPAQRKVAPALNRALLDTAAAVAAGALATEATAGAETALLEAGFDAVDYVAVADAETLAPVEKLGGRPARVLAAAFLGKTRLIDNVPVAIA